MINYFIEFSQTSTHLTTVTLQKPYSLTRWCTPRGPSPQKKIDLPSGPILWWLKNILSIIVAMAPRYTQNGPSLPKIRPVLRSGKKTYIHCIAPSTSRLLAKSVASDLHSSVLPAHAGSSRHGANKGDPLANWGDSVAACLSGMRCIWVVLTPARPESTYSIHDYVACIFTDSTRSLLWWPIGLWGKSLPKTSRAYGPVY